MIRNDEQLTICQRKIIHLRRTKLHQLCITLIGTFRKIRWVGEIGDDLKAMILSMNIRFNVNVRVRMNDLVDVYVSRLRTCAYLYTP
ncbi:unnamed protein product [Onchocerca flexuosa]|uniref:Transposase n=1 Tax=Onchocerca flexuosa TaxID=387005 RepID=A0A183HCA8_9BILA|nr:unnamed protein product [Onchocerca flexuosa]